MMATAQSEETVTVFNLDAPEVAIPMTRREFYDDQITVFRKSGTPSQAVAIVDILLFDVTGELFIQKRSDAKQHNPGLLDKSIGGHIQYGDAPNYTVMVETVQELKVPSIPLRTSEDFAKTYRLLRNYLETVAVLKHIATFTENFTKVFQSEKIMIANKKHLYFGVYNGAIRTIDREAKGVLLYPLKDLAKEMKEYPERFTDDMHYYLKHYQKQMEDFVQRDLGIST